MISVKRPLEEITALHTGQPLEKVSKDTERAYFPERGGAGECFCASEPVGRGHGRAAGRGCG